MIRIGFTFVLFYASAINANEFVNYTLVNQSIEIVLLGQKSFLDCLNQTYVATQALARGMPLENFPTTLLDERNVSFHLYTRENPIIPEILNTYNPARSIRNSKFVNFSKHTVLYVHGALQSVNETVKKLLPDILIKDDINLIIVDWDSYAFLNPYFTTSRLGPIVGNFGNQMIQAGANPKKFFFIGYSVGGQVVGLAGKVIRPKIAKILSIDPQGNCFTRVPPQFRVSKMDAEFLQIIHCTFGKLGSPLKLMGDVTFYVNGGLIQPQCKNATAALTSQCSHSVCADYFFYTIRNPNVYLGFKCYTYGGYLMDHCNCEDTSIMGYGTSTSARGTYFVQTNSAKRLCGYKAGPTPNSNSSPNDLPIATNGSGLEIV